LRLMLLGAVIALGPLAWVWLRHRRASGAQRLRALTLLTLFLTFDLVLFGAFTRLTDSGLGCPDWPGCYGSASPVGAHASISAAQQAMPTGPVTHSKAWIEMVHRYLATAVGVLILVLAVTSWIERRRLSISPAWAWLTLFWVCLQGAFGALTVTMKLFPAIVTLHLLGGMVLLALLRAQSVGYDLGVHGHAPLTLGRPVRRALLLVYALLWLQIALGGWVSTNYAVLACDTFPTCQGGWWPPMNLREGFTVWRELGMNADGQPITFAALTGIHYVHRLCAYLVLAALVGLAWQLWSRPGARSSARWLLALASLQLATGLSNVVLDWPLLAAVGHTGGAAALVVVMTGLLAATRAAPSSVSAPTLNVPRTSP
jgi:cytochrome c oxidase assembly protein subunit 15